MRHILVGLAVLATFQLLIPAAVFFGLIRGRPHSRLDWLLRALSAGSLVIFLFVASPWDIFSYSLRYALAAAYIVSITVAYRRADPRLFGIGRGLLAWARTTAVVLAALGFGALNLLAFGGFRHPRDPVELAFPLQRGVYHVGQGGSSDLLNSHHDSHRPGSPQQYALDVGKLTLVGSRAWGLYPRQLERYAIFGDIVVSPCTGRVLDAVDGLPDLLPPNADKEHPAGNHVVVECKGVHVLLAHLKRSSVRMRAGEPVREGQPVRQVGNSGNTSELHLHIHATRNGHGVPMIFDGRFLTRNSVVVSRSTFQPAQ